MRLLHNIYHYLPLILVLIMLSGCTGERCIDADDFGHSVFSVGARYAVSELEGQEEANQVAPWIRSGHRVNGRPLTMTVKDWNFGVDNNDESELSAWCPWYGSHLDGKKLSRFCERLPECVFTDEEICTDTIEARITNAPCLLKRGIGLYALIPQRDTDPNKSLNTRRNPLGIVMHLGDKPEEYYLGGMDRDGNSTDAAGRIYDYEGNIVLQEQYSGSDLYFKILDRFYDDNNGQYKVVIKSGINNTNSDPISYVIMLVKQFLFGVKGSGQLLLPGLEMSNADGIFSSNSGGVIKRLYLGIVNNPNYQFAVSALLTLYVAFTALSYLTGNIQITHTELIMRIGKIAVISALLKTEYSWNFFNDYLFVYFIGGVEQILNIIMEAGATGPGSPGIFAFMIAPQTLAKLVSLLFTDWLGWLYIILFILALYFVVMVFFKAAVIYLMALIAIGIIIIMAPIFLCFLLFDFTKSLFENWLKQLISYALQPILLFTGLIFISVILREEFYSALGFRVCKQGFPQLSTSSVLSEKAASNLPFDLGNTIFYWWFPKPMNGADFTRETKRIPIPIDHYASEGETGDIRDGFCQAYACVGERYPDLPFLDPVKDKDTIEKFHNGQFVHLSGLLLIFATLYLLHKFNDMAVGMSKSITGTSGSLTNIENVADSMRDNSFGKLNNYVASMPSRAKKQAVDYVDRQVGKRVMKAQGIDTSGLTSNQIKTMQKKYGKEARLEYSPSSLIDKARISRLKKEALTSGANKAILKEVKRDTGLSKKDINPHAIKEYQGELTKTLKKIGYDDKKSKKLAKKLVKKKPGELKDELSKAKFGKSHDNLNQTQKEEMSRLYSDNKKLRLLSAESDKARRFRTAYANSYGNMSNRGVGILGKRVGLVRRISEVKHDAKTTKQRNEAKRQQRGAKLMSINPLFNDKGYLKEKDDQLKDDKTNRKIRHNNYVYNDNVTSPEFLARAEAQNHSKSDLFNNLATEQTRLQAKALHKPWDSPGKLAKKCVTNDEYINSEDEHHIRRDLAREKIEETHQNLTTHLNRDNIKSTEMVALTKKVYGRKAAVKLEESFIEYNFSNAVLDQIDKRKNNTKEQITEIFRDAPKTSQYEAKTVKEEDKIENILAIRKRTPLNLQKKKAT